VTFYNAAGTRLTETTLNALADTVTDVELVEFSADVYQSFTQDGGGFEKASRLVFVASQRVPQSMIDGLFQTATITSVAPASGAAAGGTPIVIRGTDFSGASGVTVGGNAATAFVVVNNTTITCTTAAHTAGATDVVVLDDAGNVTSAGAFTFV
jgi:IPT/TIG domain